MRYIIDGYNFMFQSKCDEGTLEVDRENMLRSFEEAVEKMRLDLIIVFDAHYVMGERSRKFLRHFEVCYTREGESADDYIVEYVKKASSPRTLTVVSSDRELLWKSRQYFAHTMSVKAFLSWLRKRRRGVEDEVETKRYPVTKIELISSEYTEGEKAPLIPGDESYYLYHFEKRFRESVPEEEQKKGKKKRKESAEEYWRRLFDDYS